MKESRDPAIKLFGKEIPLPEHCGIPAITGDHKRGSDISGVVAREDSKLADGHRNQQQITTTCLAEKKLSRVEFEEAENKQTEAEKDPMPAKPTEGKGQGKIHPIMIEESTNTETLPEPEDSHKTLPMTEETESAKPSNENDQIGSPNNSQQQPLKKPDKILPCPRCNSMDTKFCYYNNYSINQPRHFCKACQRYWTAGGTMRNVPVGAGRRKNKNSASHCRHITISEALQVVQIDIPNRAHHAASFKPNGTVLSFGPEAPLCESMASVLNLAERKAPNGIRNGFYKTEQGMPIASAGGENGDDCSSGSSITTSSSLEEGGRNGYHQEPMSCNLNGFHSQIPFLPGAPWPYPWNSPVPIPAFCPNRFPMPIIPAPLWNCGVPGAWALPWLSPQSSTAIQRPPNSAPSSLNLGKHSRDGDLLKPSSNSEGKEHPDQKNLEGSIVIPKTLRIVDPDEGARSSIWVTLGIKNDSINKGGLFKGFQPKDGEKRHVVETSSALQANPAALSRSLSFQETA